MKNRAVYSLAATLLIVSAGLFGCQSKPAATASQSSSPATLDQQIQTVRNNPQIPEAAKASMIQAMEKAKNKNAK